MDGNQEQNYKKYDKEHRSKEQNMVKPRGRWRWLLIVAGITALLPLGIIGISALEVPGPSPNPFLAFLTFLPGYSLLALGPIVSSILWWHLIVNRAKEVNWKKGLVAMLLAEFTAYPLTAIAIGLPVMFSPPGDLPSAFLALIFLGLASFSFIVLPRFGLYTTLCALFLGPLLGGLQGYYEQKDLDA